MDKVHFSNHAVSRFTERFPAVVSEYGGDKLRAMCKAYYSSVVDNRIKNDTKFMTHVYETHGYEDFSMSVFEKMVFIVKQGVLVTVMTTDGYLGSRVTNNSSYRKH